MCLLTTKWAAGGRKKKKKQAGSYFLLPAICWTLGWGDLTSSLEGGGLQGGPYTAPSNLCSGVNVAHSDGSQTELE